MSNCMRDDCKRRATHHLVAKLWARGYPKSSAPITATIGILLCRDHAHEAASTEDVLTDAFWGAVDGITRAMGKVPVDRASLELTPTRGIPDKETFAVPPQRRH